MKKIILLIVTCLTFTSCSKKEKLVIDENFNWDNDKQALAKIFPKKKDSDGTDAIFMSDKQIKAFPSDDIIFFYSENKIDNITFRGFGQFARIEMYVDKKDLVHIKCTESDHTKYYVYGTIRTDYGDSYFEYLTQDNGLNPYLLIYRPGHVLTEREGSTSRLNGPLGNCVTEAAPY